MRWLIAATLAFGSPLAAQTAPPTTWRLSETLRIGSIDGPVALTSVYSLALSPDGRALYVAQPSDRSIWMFDASSGRFLRKIGRGGDGPGEFRDLHSVEFRADTLYATDATLARLVLFTPAGEHIRTERYDSALLHESHTLTYPRALASSGHVIVEPRHRLREMADGTITSAPWILIGRNGKTIRTLASSDLRNTYTRVPVGGGSFYEHQPMSERTHLGLDPGGGSLIVVRQPAWKDPPGSFEVERLRLDGSRIYGHIYRYSPRPVTRQIADSLYDRKARGYERYSTPARAKEIARQHITVPSVHPPVSALIVSPDGSAWLRRENLGGADGAMVGAESGRPDPGERSGSGGVKVLYADGNTMCGSVKDDLDVTYVVR